MIDERFRQSGTTRRALMVGAGAVALTALTAGPIKASPQQMAEAVRKVVGNAPLRVGRVKVELPVLTENGNSAPIAIEVESPMTAADHVKTIHIFSERNPVAHIAAFKLGPRAGRARVTTNIRLADTQQVTIVAEMSDGSFWAGHAHSEVTAPACIDESRLE